MNFVNFVPVHDGIRQKLAGPQDQGWQNRLVDYPTESEASLQAPEKTTHYVNVMLSKIQGPEEQNYNPMCKGNWDSNL